MSAVCLNATQLFVTHDLRAEVDITSWPLIVVNTVPIPCNSLFLGGDLYQTRTFPLKCNETLPKSCTSFLGTNARVLCKHWMQPNDHRSLLFDKSVPKMYFLLHFICLFCCYFIITSSFSWLHQFKISRPYFSVKWGISAQLHSVDFSLLHLNRSTFVEYFHNYKGETSTHFRHFK